jgi:hypothetical protein
VEGAVMTPAQRDGVFVADAPAKCTRLGKAKVMGVRGPFPAH